MRVHVLKNIRVDRLGNVRKGAVVEVADPVANIFLRQGAVERYETKVLREVPTDPAGELPSALPVGLVSTQTMSPESASGDSETPKKKRGRPRKVTAEQ